MSIIAQDVVTIAVGTLLINVSESPTAQDVASSQVVSDVSVTEQPTTQDAITTQMGDYIISVEEQPTGTDDINALVVSLVNVSDAAIASDIVVDIEAPETFEEVIINEQPTVADVVTVAVADYEININDPPSVQDVVDILVSSFVDISEQPAVQDSVAIETGDLKIDVNELPVVVDSISALVTSLINIIEQPTAQDAITITTDDLEINVSEQPTVADPVTDIEITAVGDENVDVNEQPSIQDTITVEVGDGDIDVSESSIVSDVVTIAIGDLEINVSEQPAVADPVTDIQVAAPGDENASVNEQPTAQDTVTVQTGDLEINVNESPTVVDVISTLVESLINIAEGPAAQDVAIITTDLGVNVSDSPSIADVVDILVSSFVDVSESPTATDVVSIVKGDLEVNVSESPAVADAATVLPEVTDLEINVSESPVVTDAITTSGLYHKYREVLEITSNIQTQLDIESDLATDVSTEVVENVLVFDGTDWYTAPLLSGLSGSDFTIEFDVYIVPGDPIYDGEGIIECSNAGGAPSFYLSIGRANPTHVNITLFGFEDGWDYFEASATVPWGYWYHVKLEKIGTTWNLYVNDNLEDSAVVSPFTISDLDGWCYIGKRATVDPLPNGTKLKNFTGDAYIFGTMYTDIGQTTEATNGDNVASIANDGSLGGDIEQSTSTDQAILEESVYSVKTVIDIESNVEGSGCYQILCGQDEHNTGLFMPALSQEELMGDWSITVTFDHWGVGDAHYQTIISAWLYDKIGVAGSQYFQLWCIQYGDEGEFHIRLQTKEQNAVGAYSTWGFFQDDEIYHITFEKDGSTLRATIIRDSDNETEILESDLGTDTFECDFWVLGGSMQSKTNIDDSIAGRNILKDFSSSPNYWAFGAAYDDIAKTDLSDVYSRESSDVPSVRAIINIGSKGGDFTFWNDVNGFFLSEGSVNEAPEGIDITSELA